MSWVLLIVAGCFEMLGVVGITEVNRRASILSYLILVGGFGLSFVFLAWAMQGIEMSVAYAVWTGIGTVGSTLVGIWMYGEPNNKRRMFFIAVIIVAVIALKWVE